MLRLNTQIEELFCMLDVNHRKLKVVCKPKYFNCHLVHTSGGLPKNPSSRVASRISNNNVFYRE